MMPKYANDGTRVSFIARMFEQCHVCPLSTYGTALPTIPFRHNRTTQVVQYLGREFTCLWTR